MWSSHRGSVTGGQWAAKSRWRLECSLTSLSEHHISHIRRRGSALIDRHARYVIAVTAGSVYSRCLCAIPDITLGRLRSKCDGTRAETRFRLSAKRTSPFKSAGHQFSRLLAAEVCASALVMLDTPSSKVVWRVVATHSIRQFSLHFPTRASPCAITFQLHS